MTIATDEIFGPVQSILKYKTIDEVRRPQYCSCAVAYQRVASHSACADTAEQPVAVSMNDMCLNWQVIKRANQSQFGLASGLWAKDIDVVNTISRGLRAGTVWVNCCESPLRGRCHALHARAR